jgi:regulatory protein
LRILARRDHSIAELKRKLVQRSFHPELVESVISSLAESGYLNDRRFAAHWAESAIENSRCFGNRLKAELSRKGVDRSVIAEIAAQVMEERGESDCLLKLVEKRYPGFDPAALDNREKQRIFGFLQRRGFSTSAIMEMFRGCRLE